MGGWISKDLFFSHKKNELNKKSYKELLFFVVLSFVICSARIWYKINYGELKKETFSWYDISYFFGSLLLFLFLFYKIVISLINKEIYFAIKCLLPLTYIMFVVFGGLAYQDKVDYLIASKKFDQQEYHYVNIVKNTPDNIDGTPKLILFHDHFGGDCDELGCLLLVYDQSDDLANIHSYHRRLFEIWEGPKAGDPPVKNLHVLINPVKAQLIKNHFYLVAVEFGSKIDEIIYK